MTRTVYIFCRSHDALAAEDVTRVATEGEFFASGAVPACTTTPDASASGWSELRIEYAAGHAPITVRRFAGDAASTFLAGELSHALEAAMRSAPTVLTIEFDPEDLTAEASELLDALKALLATHLDGIIHDPEAGATYDGCLLPVRPG